MSHGYSIHAVHLPYSRCAAPPTLHVTSSTYHCTHPSHPQIGPRPVGTSKRPSKTKVAAGMEVAFDIVFEAKEARDYRCDLVCVTEREKFIVPVRVCGPGRR